MRRWFAGQRSDGETAPVRRDDLPAPEDLRLDGEAFGDRRRVLVSLLGVDGADLGRQADLAVRSLDAGRDLPVFVVSTLAFAALRRRGHVFEYLPAAADHDAGDPAAYATYLDRRMALVRLKWSPSAEVDLGMPFDRFRAAEIGRVRARR
jgi:hypothetical protein